MDAKWSDFSSLDGERMLAAANQLLPGWVALVLAVAIAWQFARIMWSLMPGSPVGDPIVQRPPQLAAAASVDRSGGGADVQTIAAVHLFGEASEGPEATVAPQDNLEELDEYRGSLTLTGCIASRDQSESVAVISDTQNEQKTYVIGDTVAPGTTLHAIYADRVVLNRNGSLEFLALPKEYKGSSRTAAQSMASVTRTATNPQSIQNVVTQNVTALADVIRPTPYFVAGQQQGYRVYPGRDRKQFAALGLRPGDLIKDIDGAALTDPQQAMQIFNNLGSAEQVSVTVERNGKPEVLVLRTSMLNLDNTE